MMTHDEIIAVIQAHKEGAVIECRHAGRKADAWSETSSNPAWNFSYRDYRVKPEPPKPREWWIHPKTYPDCEFEKDRILTEMPINTSWIHVREVLPDAIN